MATTKKEPDQPGSDVSHKNNSTDKAIVEDTREAVVNKRVYLDEQELDHDLYKLEVAKVKKNTAIQGREPIWVLVEHCHFFHTITSAGVPQENGTSICGHFHKMTIKPNPEKGGAPFVTCGPPLTRVRKKVGHKKYRRVEVVIPYDKHTHDVSYIKSDRIQLRTMSSEFMKVQSKIAQEQKNATAKIDADIKASGLGTLGTSHAPARA